MQLASMPKLIVACLVIVSMTVLMAIHVVDPAVGIGVIGTYGGFIVGNGNSARNGALPLPIIAAKDVPA